LRMRTPGYKKPYRSRWKLSASLRIKVKERT